MAGAPLIDLSRYVFEALRKDEEYILYRAQSEDVAFLVLVLSPAVQRPTPESLKRLEHEYSLREALDPRWAARPIAVVRHGARTVLVLEDPGGAPLDQLLGHPLDPAFSLRLAIGLSTAIGQLHQRGLIHKDIKPPNVLVNVATGEVYWSEEHFRIFDLDPKTAKPSYSLFVERIHPQRSSLVRTGPRTSGPGEG
jgi:serine/threonine protein kinase